MGSKREQAIPSQSFATPIGRSCGLIEELHHENSVVVSADSLGMECTLQADPQMDFDDSASVDSTPIGAGYHLLNWNNFYFLNASTHNPSGYYAGMVSPDFVIYNESGSPASISAGMFDLLSVDATAAWNDGLSQWSGKFQRFIYGGTLAL